jgi:hypothetical protein
VPFNVVFNGWPCRHTAEISPNLVLNGMSNESSAQTSEGASHLCAKADIAAVFRVGTRTNDQPAQDCEAASGTARSPERPGLSLQALETKQQIAGFFQVKERTIERWMKRRIIPYFRIGGKVRFRLHDVVASLERNNLHQVRD